MDVRSIAIALKFHSISYFKETWHVFERRVAMQAALNPLSQYRVIFQLSARAGTETPGDFPVSPEMEVICKFWAKWKNYLHLLDLLKLPELHVQLEKKKR